MKKIMCVILATAALAACTKSETQYEPAAEIGFNVVGGNITKAVVDGTTYPKTLNMYVNAYTTDIATDAATPNYIYKGEFTYLNTYGAYVSDDTNASDAEKATNVWGGGSSTSSRNPYYWPNEKSLHFSGFSKSGNVTDLLENNITYTPSSDALSITGYTPGTGTADGANDLMWFQSTKHKTQDGYDKNTKFVPVEMYHTCSWITFIVQGDATTGSSSSSYKITSLKMNSVDQTANVTCTGNTSLSTSTLPTYVVWSENDTQTGDNTTYTVTVPDSGVELKGTYVSENSTSPKNIETGKQDDANTANENEATTDGNIVVIPQKPGTIDLAWTYKSSTDSDIADTATGLSLKISDTEADNVWKPGVHYIYTITIKANEILIAPTPVDWTENGSYTVTVE